MTTIELPKYFVALVEKQLRSYEYRNNTIVSAVLQDGILFEEKVSRRYTHIGEKHVQMYKIGHIALIGKRIRVFYFPTFRMPIENNIVKVDFEYEKVMEKVKAIPFPIDSFVRIPSFVVLLLKEDAIRKGSLCPIILEPITMENSIVTSCYHVFTKDAFEIWQQISTKCPTCRMKCEPQ